MMFTMIYGLLAAATGQHLELQVLKSAAGYYLGTADGTAPVSRESVEYWPTKELAEAALASGSWTQREHP